MSFPPTVILQLPLSTPDRFEALQAFVKRSLEDKVELIAVVGEGCGVIEDRIDSYIVMSGPDCFITTTSHPKETLEDVLDFARVWHRDGRSEPEVVKL
ncbi:hypothetical protein ACFSM5_10460 [Lacibacterium aquatile]|uniref:Uncharacterized protein n=1 Tax=Lacibacterium aquatile TaxID=1168082 RepID=A0ABW5DS34_9PROT